MNKIACQYAIVRFAPFVETGEFANVGIVLMSAQHRYFGFKIETRRHGRITRFFDQLDAKVYRATMQDMREELGRVHQLLKEHGFDRRRKSNDVVFAAHLFAELIRPRESIVRFSQPRAVLAQNPAKKLQELFAYYIERNFVTQKYRETVLEENIRGWLRQSALQTRFQRAVLGDDEYEVSFPFVEMAHNRALKVIKPLHLGQKRPTQIIDHGGSWAFRLQQLIDRSRFPEQILFAVDGPTPGADDRRQRAFADAVGRLEEMGVTLVNASERDRVLEFAAA